MFIEICISVHPFGSMVSTPARMKLTSANPAGPEKSSSGNKQLNLRSALYEAPC